jgi:hypothetical protein
MMSQEDMGKMYIKVGQDGGGVNQQASIFSSKWVKVVTDGK